MKRPMVLLPPLSLLGTAQSAPTCETVMADLEETAATTQSVTRTLTMRAGERGLSHSVVRVAQGENGPQVTTLEERGQQPGFQTTRFSTYLRLSQTCMGPAARFAQA